jgi:thiol-disulfide isomerase/thioredoxin
MSRAAIVATAIAISLGLGGCVATDPLAQTATNQNFTSTDGTLTEIHPENRGEPVEFVASNTTDGSTVRAADYRGSVLVVNFWYAACPPCRFEAPTLAESAAAFGDEGVRFLGVNVYDDVAGANSFEKKFGIPYPSVLDADTGDLRLAFAQELPPSGVPTTLIIDRDGRVAARVLGAITNRATFEDMITSVVAEATP